METFPKDPFETVKARIVSGDERPVMGVLGRQGGLGWWKPWNSCFWMRGDWVAQGGVGSSEVGGENQFIFVGGDDPLIPMEPPLL